LFKGVFVSYIINPDGTGTAYLKPMQEYFELNCQGMGLIDLWGIFGFAQRREYDPNNPRANILMPGKEGVSIVLLLQDNTTGCLYL